MKLQFSFENKINHFLNILIKKTCTGKNHLDSISGEFPTLPFVGSGLRDQAGSACISMINFN